MPDARPPSRSTKRANLPKSSKPSGIARLLRPLVSATPPRPPREASPTAPSERSNGAVNSATSAPTSRSQGEHLVSGGPRDLFERHRSVRALVALAITAFAIYIFNALWAALVLVGDVIILFLLAWLIAFILEPLSIWLRRLGLSRVVAVSLIYLTLLIVVSVGVALAVPAIAYEISAGAAIIRTDLSPANIITINRSAVQTLQRFGMHRPDAQNIVNQVLSQAPGALLTYADNAVGSASQLLSSIFTIILDATLIVILSFYMMLEGEILIEKLVARTPPAWVPSVRLFQSYVDQIFAGYFRAQLIIAAIYAIFTWGILAALGAPGAWLVAAISGLLLILPLIGPFLSIAPPALALLLHTPTNELLFKEVLLIFLLAAAQHLVLNLLAPRIFGQHMGVPTLLLFGALLLGAAEGGVWGAFFAAPIIALAYALARVAHDRFSATSPLYMNAENGATTGDDAAGDSSEEITTQAVQLTSNGAETEGSTPASLEHPDALGANDHPATQSNR
ncbi:MAG: AI-2E family transporter [Ktedonobacterales bacterium]